jgi:hypothetical protein
MYMKNKNFRKLKYVQANPENAGLCTIYPTASGPDPWPIFFPLGFDQHSPPTFSK